MVSLCLQMQTFEFHIRPQTGEDRVALRTNGFGWRSGKTGIALDGFVALFDFPPFLVDCLDLRSAQGCVTGDQRDNALTFVLVCKDLHNEQ